VGTSRSVVGSLAEQIFGQSAMLGSGGASIWLACGAPSRVEIQQACVSGVCQSSGPLGLKSGDMLGLQGRGQWSGDQAGTLAGLCSGGPEDWTSSGCS
jgi:hypothetical protein